MKERLLNDDRPLIDATLAGDRQAFGALVLKYQNRLLNSVTHVVGNPTDAQDVVQEAFVLAFTKLDTFQAKSRFYTWLFRIARNVAISKMRSKKSTASLDRSEGSRVFAVVDAGPTPDDPLRRAEDVEQLQQALTRLSEEHRSILVMRELDDLDYEQIADVLEIPVGTVRSRLHRARSQLREQLEFLSNAIKED